MWNETVPPARTVPKAHVRTLMVLSTEHPPVSNTYRTADVSGDRGSRSTTTTFAASDEPWFVTVTANMIVLDGSQISQLAARVTSTSATTATFVVSRSKLFELSVSITSLMTVASFRIRSRALVATRTTIVMNSEPNAPRDPNAQRVGSAGSPGVPATQAPPAAPTASTVVSAGSRSFTTTFVAVGGPLLVTVREQTVVAPRLPGRSKLAIDTVPTA